ncbi:hypothetical protein ACFOEE_07070 [Pseudoalteromonas fenneropenaei]|uniref:Phytanoyl-CoA dioxygenase n=1 Tax=Pseudoalteromonas fenneropenaei TaxID=1737459 RepID=A0ABV7CID1_9GAMM
MRDLADLQRFKYLVDTLLTSTPDLVLMQPFTNELTAYLGNICGISAEFDLNDWQHAKTANGVAISPVSAAKCSLETLRSQIFMQGVQAAITDKLASKPSIHILYAGTGPYGTLLLPYLACHANLPIKVTLLDIHPENIAAVEKLIHHFGIENYIEALVCDDATSWQPELGKQFDLIISETMTALLKNEPQVWIFAHLVQFLAPDGCLIPEVISLKAQFLLKQIDDDDNLAAGEFFRLDQHSALSIQRKDLDCLQGHINVPAGITPKHKLGLTTDIQVYKQHTLTLRQCSLNLPFTLPQPKDLLEAGAQIRFAYETPAQPEFVFYFPQGQQPLSKANIVPSESPSPSGLFHLSRAFQQARLQKYGDKIQPNDTDRLREQVLCNALGLTLHQWYEHLFTCDSLEELEQCLQILNPKLHGPDFVQNLNSKLLSSHSDIS